ncbi:MAG: hypothetical protein ACR2PS_07045 [Pseudomonadales bacterium]
MRKKTPTMGLNTFLMAGVLFVMGAFQQSDAQDVSGHQTPSQLQFTRDAAAAYLDALEFCLSQIGSSITFDAQARQMMLNELNRQFPSLPLAEQVKLATAPATWHHYKTSWNALSMEQKTAFAFDVFTLAFGEEAARQALGLSSAGSNGAAPVENFDDVKDDFCTSPDVLAMGGCP